MIGLGTFAFFWQHSKRAPQALDLPAMLRKTRELGAEVFQICDYAPILSHTRAQLRDLKSLADELDLALELGTRGILPEHLANILRLAEALGAKVVRSIVNTADHRPTLSEAQALLKQALPAYESCGVKIALETYE